MKPGSPLWASFQGTPIYHEGYPGNVRGKFHAYSSSSSTCRAEVWAKAAGGAPNRLWHLEGWPSNTPLPFITYFSIRRRDNSDKKCNCCSGLVYMHCTMNWSKLSFYPTYYYVIVLLTEYVHCTIISLPCMQLSSSGTSRITLSHMPSPLAVPTSAKQGNGERSTKVLVGIVLVFLTCHSMRLVIQERIHIAMIIKQILVGYK